MSKLKLRLILATILVGTLLCLILFRDKSYSRVYDIDNYKITEEYNDEEKYYYFEIKHENVTYEYILLKKYNGKEIISKIESYTHADEICLILSNTFDEKIILCAKDSHLIATSLISDELNAQLPEKYRYDYSSNSHDYQDLKITNTTQENIYIWNYSGFDHISTNHNDTIPIFQKDIYNTSLITTINEYIFIPNYEQDHNFNEVYLYNSKSEEIITWQLKYDISYDSYIMGIEDKSIYLIDRKNKIQYELVPHKQKMRIIAKNEKQGITYDGEFHKEKLTTIINNNIKFTKPSPFNYHLEDNQLFLSYQNSQNKILITNKNITSIIATNQNKIYYLSDTILYYYDPSKGEIPLIEKEEWHFNSDNKIYIIF